MSAGYSTFRPERFLERESITFMDTQGFAVYVDQRVVALDLFNTRLKRAPLEEWGLVYQGTKFLGKSLFSKVRREDLAFPPSPYEEPPLLTRQRID